MSFAVFLTGLFLGSFLALLGWRLPRRKPVVFGRSHCDHCHRVLAWYELIPVFSYFFQGGRCSGCRTPLSLLYPISEIVCGLGLLLLYNQWGLSAAFFLAGIAFCACLVLCVSDVLYQVLPDGALLIAGLAILGFVALSPHPAWLLRFTTAAAACAFFAFLWAITRRRGMGFGDVKLVFVLGFLLGYPAIIIALYGAFLTGAVVGVILILGRFLKLKSKIAFGPFLFIGTAMTLLWSEEILGWWQGLML